MSVRVLVVDDQELFRAGFALILDSEPDISVVGTAADGFDAVAQAHALAPDVVVMDVRMPRLDGVAATRRICAETAAKVLVLTMFDTDDTVYAALRAGASGFLLKDMQRAELIAAVRVIAAGEALLAPSVTRRLIATLSERGGPRPELARRLDGLTERELDTLRQLARGRSNVEIAAALTVTEHTVKTHVSAVLSKLGLRDRVQAVVFAYEAGLVVPGAGD
ncbi:DNA-binding response regulator [Nocardia panacis]|uniref:DNA-binding response regulator n=1 Tax=Nocardia panacis TaxID=2340916 RepID=A0A3A4KK53_9NOCA|nr:response regulator transcription factor [Nocardia panacis]RJO75071.1 DNA-binding response regulator [Nocardia panacis]